MRNYRVIMTGFVFTTALLIAAQTQADLIYRLTDSKDHTVEPLWAGITFVLSEINDGAGANLALHVNDYGIEHGFLLGKDGVKFKDFGMDPGNLFTSIPSNWSNGGFTTDKMNTSLNLTFASGLNWETFVEDYAEELVISAHIQSVNNDIGVSNSINKAEFTYANEPATATPEPATLAILAAGLGGLVTRRKRKALNVYV